MCAIQTLACSEEGYIIRCPECERMQLSFGVAAITLKKKQFLQLKERARLELMYPGPVAGFPGQKSVTLPVNAAVALCLDLRELQALTELIDQAAALIEVYEMLS